MQTIGVLVADIVNPYYAEITRGIEDVARQLSADSDPATTGSFNTLRLPELST